MNQLKNILTDENHSPIGQWRRVGLQAFLLVIVSILYIIAVFQFSKNTGAVIAALAIVPVMCAGLLWGMWGGFCVGLLFSLLINPLLLNNLGFTEWTDFLSIKFIPGGMGVVLAGCVVGYMQQLRQQINDELIFRNQAEQALAESRERFHELFSSMSSGVTIIDVSDNGSRFIATDLNRAAERIMQRDRTQIIGQDLASIFPGAIENGLVAHIKAVWESGSARQFPIVMKSGGNVLKWIENSAYRLTSGQIVVVFDDVTEHRLAEEKVRCSEELLRHKNAEILELTNSVAHDLKNPLSAIKAVVSMAQSGDLGNQSSDSLESFGLALEAIVSMEVMLRDLLECAHLENSTVQLEKSACILDEAVTPVLEGLRLFITKKRIAIETSGLDAVALVDPRSLSKILINLISNSIKYIGPASSPQITISARTEATRTVLSIADNGMGISVDSQKQLFRKFKRGSNARGIAGNGLGLAIVKAAVEANGGTIWFESEEGKGATFFVSLPNAG